MSVRVVARVRPLLKSELDKDVIVRTDGASGDGEPNIVRIPNPKNEVEDFSFQFNSVYGSETTQQHLFEKEVAPTVKHLFNGFDVTIFAYGVTGTGKTHTMRGGKSLADRGVIPRFLSGVYRRCRKVEKDSGGETHVEVSMSYYEIYNDKVFDLFEAPEKRTPSGLPLRDNGGKTVVVGLTERPCESLKDFERLYDQANVNRSTSATKLNAHSSRSHAILCVKLKLSTGDIVRVSTASAIDLAGSEDNRRTDNNRERLVESSSINKSLFVLAQCVEAISKKQARIPYRESKMTRILSLGQNNGFTLMVLNLAPVRSYHLDTLSSLNFANRTKKIEVREIENEPVFKGCPRQVAISLGPAMQRQPLRPLTGAAHNSNVRPVDTTKKPSDKTIKAFSVYADKARTSLNSQRPVPSKSLAAPKRPSDLDEGVSGRPHKAMRQDHMVMSKATIEDMVEKKVTELLATRELDRPAPRPANDITEEVKRRLEHLEQRIESREDEKSEGLTFLLMAKQHQARGENTSALKMYEMARAFFPDNEKLEEKITKLRHKISAQGKHSPSASGKIAQIPPAKAESIVTTARRTKTDREDADYEYEENEENDSADEQGSKARPRALKRKTPASLAIEPILDAAQTPRTKNLLDIVNSRDASQIRLLRGVGAKKAKAIIAALCCGGEDPVEVGSLAQLGKLRGVGAKTVENMRAGLAPAGDVHDF